MSHPVTNFVVFGLVIAYSNYLPAPPAHASQCATRLPDPRSYLKTQAANLTDQAIEAVLNAKYSEVHYFEVISVLVAGERAFDCIGERNYVTALEVMASLGAKHMLKDALQYVGLATLSSVTSLAVAPINYALQLSARRILEDRIEFNIKTYADFRNAGFTHEEIIAGENNSWRGLEFINGWLIPLQPKTWGSSMARPVSIEGITPRHVYELAQLVYEGQQGFNADKLAVLTSLEKASPREKLAEAPQPAPPRAGTAALSEPSEDRIRKRIDEVVPRLVAEAMSSKPFASVKVGTTPAEVVRRYIEAFKTHDILTLAALNNQDALYRIARIRETYPQVLWKDELRKWAEVYVSNLVRGFEATPKMVGGWGSLLGDWDPGFLVVESLTYEVLEAKPGLDVTLVFVRVTYPPGSLRRGPNPIKQAVIEIRVLKNFVQGFRVISSQ